MVLRARELLVRQRTQAVNALRGHATEFGLVVPLGVSRIEELLAKLAADPAVPTIAREMLAVGPDVALTWTAACDSPTAESGLRGNDLPQRKKVSLVRCKACGAYSRLSISLLPAEG